MLNPTSALAGMKLDTTVALITDGRFSGASRGAAKMCIRDREKPGQLTRVSEIISGMGANVVSVQYDLADPNMTGDVRIIVLLSLIPI